MGKRMNYVCTERNNDSNAMIRDVNETTQKTVSAALYVLYFFFPFMNSQYIAISSAHNL